MKEREAPVEGIPGESAAKRNRQDVCSQELGFLLNLHRSNLSACSLFSRAAVLLNISPPVSHLQSLSERRRLFPSVFSDLSHLPVQASS